jgi:hypothetical protein
MPSDDNTERRRPVDPPVCPRCHGPMKLTRIEPHPHYISLMNENYECESCGETASATMRVT